MVDATSNAIPEQLRDMIEMMVEDAVERRLIEILGDPDEGLELREEIVEQLKAQQARIAAGDRGRPIEEIKKELGLL